MREQTIVWRNDFENIEFPKWTLHMNKYRSVRDTLCYVAGGFSLGHFLKHRETDRICFEELGTDNFYSQEEIEEFAFLE